MSTSNAITGFSPSVNGLHFANNWASGPTIRLGVIDPRRVGIGDASNGLCGGMAWFVRERFEGGRPIPPDTIAPDNGSPLFRTIVRGQILSLRWLTGPYRFWWTGLRGPHRALRQTYEIEWPRVHATIDSGKLALLGLVRHSGWNPMNTNKSHTVLAYAYSIDSTTEPAGPTITLRIYDPNHPNRDDVTVTISPSGLTQNTGEHLTGILSLDELR